MRKRKVKTTELILTPLIDCVLFLMTFLLLVTDFTRQDEFDIITLPDITQAKLVEQPDPERLVLMVDRDGVIYISGTATPDEKVKRVLAFEAMKSRERPQDPTSLSNRMVLVGADERCPWAHVQRIINWCTERRIGIWRLAFAILPTEKREAPPAATAGGGV